MDTLGDGGGIVDKVWANLHKYLLQDILPHGGEGESFQCIDAFIDSNMCIGISINDGGRNEIKWLFQAPRMIPDDIQNRLIIRSCRIVWSEECSQLHISCCGVYDGSSFLMKLNTEGEWVDLSVSWHQVAEYDVASNLVILNIRLSAIGLGLSFSKPSYSSGGRYSMDRLFDIGRWSDGHTFFATDMRRLLLICLRQNVAEKCGC